MFEVEQKYHVHNRAELVERLAIEDAILVSENENRDTYYNHPCRDFSQTGEALRVRRIDGVPLVTFKGTKRPGLVKAREELEWRLDPGDDDGTKMERLLIHLGFREVATVTKRRETYRLGGAEDAITITIDEVASLGRDGQAGLFAEIECVLPDANPTDDTIEATRARVSSLALTLGLREPEPRSYLRMQLER
ncbi:class IV adenylate cyclase [Aporhodopirellula aestuarii]|uniref:Class IV adenylate cyclase n=1 Tax=Aporhodopirellula aestuarii TaxID=2950107 RepID=A0ABT0U749_9BACT|nr:class IV adenylate cyclase [Aporhodopirellula aestuarii]MCM2372504.1 class IV adenylate cyclase [Aporhodopirellula aestuarii]